MLQIPELLAPAGDLERLRYAINYGADAVYCSLPEFGMRSAPANFTPEQLTEGVIYAHARGRKVYLTMNTLPTNEEADRLPDAIKEAAKAGVDAFIVADLGVLDACKTVAPDIDVHMSTQTGITNWLISIYLFLSDSDTVPGFHITGKTMFYQFINIIIIVVRPNHLTDLSQSFISVKQLCI